MPSRRMANSSCSGVIPVTAGVVIQFAFELTNAQSQSCTMLGSAVRALPDNQNCNPFRRSDAARSLASQTAGPLKCEICGGFYDAVAIDPGADSGSSDTGDLQFLLVARATETQ